MKYIKSPLNYTGNKLRILDQIIPYFPEKIDCMVDMFCGGATVGLNTNAKKVIFVDSNERVINLLIYLSKLTFEDFLCQCEKKIKHYKLSFSYKDTYRMYRIQCNNLTDNNGLKDYNYEGFYRLRDDYNALIDKNSDEANLMLYLLMVYSFNNDMRFNSNGDFNLPVGKTDLNRNNVLKIKSYIERVKKIDAQFVCADFQDKVIQTILNNADFIYMDPPYLLGNAVYNSKWNIDKEYQLLQFIDGLRNRKINFALSNVIEKIGEINEPLLKWYSNNTNELNIHNITYHYRSASYNKTKRNAKEQEILITNR